MNFKSFGGPGVGFFPDKVQGICFNRTSATIVAIGDVLMCDMTATGAKVATTNAQFTNEGTAGNPSSQAVLPLTASIGAAAHSGVMFVCVTDLLNGAGAVGAKFMGLLKGICLVNVAAATVYSDWLGPANGSIELVRHTGATLTYVRMIAYALSDYEATTGDLPPGTGSGLAWCYFDGETGMWSRDQA